MDRIPADQLTVSLFREGYPQELFRSLEHYGLTVSRKYDGIYYVYGLYVPAQIVVTKELEGGKHRSLRILSRNATEEDIRGFVREAQTLTGQGERPNGDAVGEHSGGGADGSEGCAGVDFGVICEEQARCLTGQ